MSHDSFERILNDVRDTQAAKDHDYSGGRRLAGYREGERLRPPQGEKMPAWYNAFLRFMEKYSRVIELFNQESEGRARAVNDESPEKTMIDMIVGLCIVIELREEQHEQDAPKKTASYSTPYKMEVSDKVFTSAAFSEGAVCALSDGRFPCSEPPTWFDQRLNRPLCTKHKEQLDYIDLPK